MKENLIQIFIQIVHNFLGNGDIIVSLLPVNESCAWLTPAVFKPHLVPEELMCSGLTVSVSIFNNIIF